jgi:hypothetical protein
MHPSDIIKYIVWYATQSGIRLSTNRLVKFIYLADLYYARYNSGVTLTGFPWKFIYYGPYCREAMWCIDQAVSDGSVCKATYESYFGDEKEYSLFISKDMAAENIENLIPLSVLGPLQKIITKMGDDTPQLLDYVYFDTEPMVKAKKGDLLDFTKAKKPQFIETVKLKKLSPDAIKLARQKIKQLGVSGGVKMYQKWRVKNAAGM